MIALSETHAAQYFDLTRAAGRVLTILLLVTLAGVASVHAGYFKDGLSFWQNAVQTSPHSPLARAMLGGIYRGQG